MTSILAAQPINVAVSGARGYSFADIARRTGDFGVLAGDGDSTVNVKFARSALASNTDAEPGQLITRAAGDAPLYIGITGATVANAVAATDLASKDGAKLAGFQAVTTAPVINVDDALKTLSLTPAFFNTSNGQAGNVSAFDTYLTARKTAESAVAAYGVEPPTTVHEATPKLSLVSDPASGKGWNGGFPTAVRYQNYDYILYRDGYSHTEQVPITNTSRFVVAKRRAGTDVVISRTVVYNENTYDPRDPGILRDDYGNAILVGGKFKVVHWRWKDGYDGVGTTDVRVSDLDPTNLAAGLVNPVQVPGIDAVKSDVRQLANGSFAFIGYTLDNICHLVTTADWATFDLEEIGPGNEAAFIETKDGYLNAVVRCEENYSVNATLFYKKNQASGSWYLHGVIPHKLNAPTFAKVADWFAGNGYHEGYYLFARDKTERHGYGAPQVPVSNLVAFRSRNNNGLSINSFAERRVIAANPNATINSGGDSHYCSVITSPISLEVAIYTYAEFNTTPYSSVTPAFAVGLFAIRAAFDQASVLVTEKCRGRNYIKNSDLSQGLANYVNGSAQASLITDTDTGRNILRFSGVIVGDTDCVLDVPPGETLYLKMRMRTTVAVASGLHAQARIYDRSTSPLTLVRQESPILRTDRFNGDWITYVSRPFIAPASGKLQIAIATATGSNSGTTDFAFIEVSDDYTTNLNLGDRFNTIVKAASPQFPISVTPNTPKGSGTYSATIWDLFGLDRRGAQLPWPAKTGSDIRLICESAKSGTVPVVMTDYTVADTGAVTATFATAPGETGNVGTTVNARITAVIQSS